MTFADGVGMLHIQGVGGKKSCIMSGGDATL